MSMRQVSGRLLFRQAGAPRPLHSMPFKLGVHRLLPLGAPSVASETDINGRFRVELPLGKGVHDLRLTLQEMHLAYDGDGQPTEKTADAAAVNVGLATGQTELGDILVGYWPYRADFPLPRAGAVDGKLPQAYTRGYSFTLAKALVKVLPGKLFLKGLSLLGRDRPTMAEIQARQPRSLTQRVEEKTPGRTRSDAWLADQLLNGFDVSQQVGRDAEDPRRLRAVIVWGDMPARADGEAFDLTDVDVILEERGAEVVPVRIGLRIRTPGKDGVWASDIERVIRPGEPDWEEAKRVVRCQYLLKGALDGHITRAHFQTDAAATATFRNLRRNPARRVLAPHLQEIVAQDKDGDSFAWGPRGILVTQSALTLSAVHSRMAGVTAGFCWSTFQPRTAIHPSHRYAKAGQLYWEMLGEYLSAFFAEHQQEIRVWWPEVLALSEDLVAHSVAYLPLPEDPRVVPIDRNELDRPEIPRAIVNGVIRAVRPITRRPAAGPGDLERLLQFCRYVIYNSTFNHGWTHDGQYGAGGELAYATFGLRNGSLGAEDDPTINPPPLVMLEGISTNSIGLNANYGYILANEERDVPPALRAALSARRDAFADLGVDVERVRSRINI